MIFEGLPTGEAYHVSQARAEALELATRMGRRGEPLQRTLARADAYLEYAYGDWLESLLSAKPAAPVLSLVQPDGAA